MKDDSVISLKKPEGNFDDHLTEILRHGCGRILEEALAVEIEAFIGHYRHLNDEEGRQRVIRNGYLPKREIQTGIGQVAVRVPRSRDRGTGAPITFRSSLLPPYLRRTRSIEELLPWLYLKGISTGDFSEALGALVGSDAPGLSAGTIGRLKEKWRAELEEWRKRDLRGKQYIYLWVDGIYCNVRMEERQCLLVIIGATEDGKKELVALEDGYRESELSWVGVLRDLKRHGLEKGPELVTGDGALGFWKAVEKMYPETKWQRVLGTQDGQCIEHASQKPPEQSKTDAA